MVGKGEWEREGEKRENTQKRTKEKTELYREESSDEKIEINTNEQANKPRILRRKQKMWREPEVEGEGFAISGW